MECIIVVSHAKFRVIVVIKYYLITMIIKSVIMIEALKNEAAFQGEQSYSQRGPTCYP